MKPLIKSLQHGLQQGIAASFAGDCYLCSAPARADVPLCAACFAELPTHQPGCPRCAVTMPEGQILCGRCQANPPAYDQVVSLFAYEEPVKSLLIGLKFHKCLLVSRMMAPLLVEVIHSKHLSKPDALLPVPLSRVRLARRGFNQALELAKPVSKALNIRLLSRHVIRHKYTPPQSELPSKRRRTNVKGVFRVDQSFSAERVLIIDDVMTTGATVDELAKLLKRQGVARFVDVLTVARA